MTRKDRCPGGGHRGSDGDRGRSDSEDSAPVRQREVTAVAYLSPPIGRRSLWAVVVVRCPICSHLHIHRSTGPHGGRRTGSCGTSYRIVIAGRRRGSA
jgi:hypothetical protein